MELIQLRALVMIQQEGTFTRAAERLHVSQPALSQQIKALERELDAPLFERMGRRIALTAVGKVVLARAEQILGQLAVLQSEVDELLTMARGQVRIGTSDTICLYLLPPIVQTFRETYPQIDIHLTNRPSQEIVMLLQTCAIDFGIVTLPVTSEGVETTYLCDREDVAVCAPTHPLRQSVVAVGSVEILELVTYPLLLLEKGTTSRAFLDQCFTQAGVTPQAMELGSIEVLKRYAETNLGVAIVPEMSIQGEVAAGQLSSFALPWLPARAIGLISRRESYQTLAAKAFMELLVAWSEGLSA